MLKRNREKVEKLTADLRKLKEDSDNLDLTVFSKITDLNETKANFNRLFEDNRTYCDDK